MTIDFSEESATRAVTDSFGNCRDDRLAAVLAGIVRHLHDFIREIEPTQHEWNRGIEFLTETGRLSDGRRQEFILLSDVLGASMLVDAINNRKPRAPLSPPCSARSTSVTHPHVSWEPISR